MTSPTVALPGTGSVQGGVQFAGSLITAVGDFDGDGHKEIALVYQQGNPASFVFSRWRYVANADGTRSLNQITTCSRCGGQPFGKALGTNKISLVNDYTDAAADDFDGDGRADLARPLWTSTGVQGYYRDETRYVAELVAPGTA
jgi:hypothetical protein